MSVTLVTMGSRYDCNAQYSEYILSVTVIPGPIFTSVTLILGPYRKTLHSYLDPFVLNVTLISGPLSYLSYTHTVTQS